MMPKEFADKFGSKAVIDAAEFHWGTPGGWNNTVADDVLTWIKCNYSHHERDYFLLQCVMCACSDLRKDCTV